MPLTPAGSDQMVCHTSAL